MMVRPVLRALESRLAVAPPGGLIRRELGLGAVAEYTRVEAMDRSRYLYGVYEYVYASAFIGQVAPGSTAIDVGANLGEYSLLAARAAGPDGAVIAVEPNPEMVQRILHNAALSRVANLRIVPLALGSSDGIGTLSVPGDLPALGSLGVRDTGDGRVTRYQVKVKPLDEVLTAEELRRLSVVKVDVEGWEHDVFVGGRRTLTRSKPVVFYECGAEEFIEHGGQYRTRSMLYLEELGYRNHYVQMDREGRWSLRDLAGTSDPRQLREPWTVLMVAAIHPEGSARPVMSGQTPLQPCSPWELLGRKADRNSTSARGT